MSGGERHSTLLTSNTSAGLGEPALPRQRPAPGAGPTSKTALGSLNPGAVRVCADTLRANRQTRTRRYRNFKFQISNFIPHVARLTDVPLRRPSVATPGGSAGLCSRRRSPMRPPRTCWRRSRGGGNWSRCWAPNAIVWDWHGRPCASHSQAHIAWLERQLATLDDDIATAIRQSPVWQAREDSLRSVPGVGPQTARTLIAHLPELGHLSHRARGLGRRCAVCVRQRTPAGDSYDPR